MQIKNTGDIQQQHINVLVHSPAGYGKTTLATTTEQPTIILSAEAGLLSINNAAIDYVDIKHMGDLHAAYQYLKTDQKYKWVVLDSVSEITSMCLIEQKKLTGDPRQAYTKMRDIMLGLIRDFRNLDKNVYMTCQQSTDEPHSPMTDDRVITQNLAYMFDCVFPLRRIEHEEKMYHVLQTEGDDTHIAKYRDSLQRLDRYEPANLQKIYTKLTQKG